jgi:hypothetical protein
VVSVGFVWVDYVGIIGVLLGLLGLYGLILWIDCGCSW